MCPTCRHSWTTWMDLITLPPITSVPISSVTQNIERNTNSMSELPHRARELRRIFLPHITITVLGIFHLDKIQSSPTNSPITKGGIAPHQRAEGAQAEPVTETYFDHVPAGFTGS